LIDRQLSWRWRRRARRRLGGRGRFTGRGRLSGRCRCRCCCRCPRRDSSIWDGGSGSGGACGSGRITDGLRVGARSHRQINNV